MNVNHKTILPKVSAAKFRVSKFFSEASASAIDHGLSASKVRGATISGNKMSIKLDPQLKLSTFPVKEYHIIWNIAYLFGVLAHCKNISVI